MELTTRQCFGLLTGFQRKRLDRNGLQTDCGVAVRAGKHHVFYQAQTVRNRGQEKKPDDGNAGAASRSNVEFDDPQREQQTESDPHQHADAESLLLAMQPHRARTSALKASGVPMLGMV